MLTLGCQGLLLHVSYMQRPSLNLRFQKPECGKAVATLECSYLKVNSQHGVVPELCDTVFPGGVSA